MDGQIPTTPMGAPIQVPVTQSAAGGIATPQDIASMIAPIAAQANAPLPDPYKQGVDIAQPHVNPVHQYQPKETQNRPIAPYVADVKRARRQNAVAGLANTIGQAGQRLQEDKQRKLTDKLTDVMKSKQNIANANTVLQDPSASAEAKKMAQNVLNANKKRLDGILNDPKSQKELAKALDVSYVDPEKNKTPEVAAYQKAAKEFETAGPYNSDNPMEASVAKLAESMYPGAKQMQPQKPVMQQPAQPNVVRSTTPYADKVLAKDTPTIESNPQYNAALAQKQAAEKQLSTMIPHIIDAESKAQLQAAKDNSTAGREVFKAASDYQRQMLVEINKANIANAKNKAEAQRAASNNAAAMARTMARVNAAEKLWERKDFSEKQKKNVKTQSLTDLNKTIYETTQTVDNDNKAIAALNTQYLDPKGNLLDESKSEEYKSALASAQLRKQMDVNFQEKLQTLRGQRFGDSWQEFSTNPGLTIATGVSNADGDTNTTKSGIESVGASDSDEPDDSDENSDEYIP